MISIIIPVLNEGNGIKKLLSHILNASSHEIITQIIVVDGGSEDHTILEVESMLGENSTIELVKSNKGRAVQMNKGASVARGEILYFLHADTIPPLHFDSLIKRASEQGFRSGCFRMKFDSDHLVLRLSQWFTRFNYKFCRGGDQSLFVDKEVFKKLGGYNEDFTIYEDCQFINRLYDTYNFTVIKKYVTTSARKYSENGTWKLQYHFTIIHLKKWLGASPEKLYNYYIKNIAS